MPGIIMMMSSVYTVLCTVSQSSVLYNSVQSSGGCQQSQVVSHWLGAEHIIIRGHLSPGPGPGLARPGHVVTFHQRASRSHSLALLCSLKLIFSPAVQGAGRQRRVEASPGETRRPPTTTCQSAPGAEWNHSSCLVLDQIWLFCYLQNDWRSQWLCPDLTWRAWLQCKHCSSLPACLLENIILWWDWDQGHHTDLACCEED